MTEETLFQEALAKSPKERAAFLQQACAGRPELRAAVEARLAANDNSSNILDKPPADLGQTVDSEPGEQVRTAASPQLATAADHTNVEPGVVIAGRYVLQQRIGEGGMGEVWVAKQTEPVKRKVALKLIKTGMDSRAVLQRFEQERQALAMMDHPNIAKVLDGGMTPTGQPFFVMELVNGLQLNKFCDEAKLTTKERLELFVPICQAVQHAHQKGIVHRDLKPANILVTLIDAKPVPKVIDFVVAKATGGKRTDESMSTQFGAILGTFEYMAPEQAGFSGNDIDTRADIYSLGVILYDLLTGLRPIDAKRLKKAALAEMIRIIQEEEPSKPRTRLSTDEALPSLAALRQIDPRKLMALLRGELDWVVLKCQEKQREGRYETASGLARDVQRYLADEVVEARPPSAGCRMRKFVRRHKGQVIAASLVLFALLAGMAGTTFGLIRAEQQRQVAERAADAERLAKLDAEQAAAAERLAKVDAESKRVQAEEQQRRAEAGEKLAKERLEELNKIITARELTNYINSSVNLLNAGEVDRAIAQLHKALELDQRNVDTLQRLGEVLMKKGQLDEAIASFRKVAELDPKSISVDAWLGESLRQKGQLDEAIASFRKDLELGANDAPVYTALGDALRQKGQLDEAIASFRKAIELNPNFPLAHAGLGAALVGKGQWDEAIASYRKAIAIDPKNDGMLAELGSALLKQEKWDEAEPLLHECLTIREKTQPDSLETFYTQSLLGGSLLGQKKYAAAEPLLLKGYEGMQKQEGITPAEGKIRLVEAVDRLIELSTAMNKPDEAKKWRAKRAKYLAETASPPQDRK